MRNILMAVLLVFSTVASAAGKEVKVKGMVCSFCAQGIEKKLRAHKEVSQVQVNLDEKWVRIDFAKDQSLPDEAIRKIIVDSGFEVVSLNEKP